MTDVLHLTKEFSPLYQTFVYDYIQELERQGVDNHVVTFDRRNPQSRPFRKVTLVERPGFWHPRRLLYRSLAALGTREPFTSDWPILRDRLRDVVRTLGPDLVHAHFGPQGVLISDVVRELDVPLVVTFYGYDISSLPASTFWREAYETLWSTCGSFTVLSREMQERTEELGCPADKINVVHLARDMEEFVYEPPGRTVSRVLFVGRLVPKKAPLDAVRAVRAANERGRGLHLDVVGDGVLRQKLLRFVREAGMDEAVTWHGEVSNERVKQHMRSSDALLLPSKTDPEGDREGTPTVLIEAQALGLPCVSTRHAGIPEMIPEENHEYLAGEGDVEGIADGLTRLSEESVEGLREMTRRGRDRVEEAFSLRGEVETLRGVYRRLLDGRGVSP